MNKKIIYCILGIIFFNYSFSANSILPTKEQFQEIITTKTCNGRKQLEKYKEIYEAHLQKLNEDKSNCFISDVENLDIPLSWAYANAYARLKELEKNDTSIAQIIGCLPTEALKRLFNEHVQDPLIPLSITTFKNYVLDIVNLMDLYFHHNEKELYKKTLDDIFSNKNKSSPTEFFSPVFLRRQGISIESINFAFFDDTGPYLSVTEVGPNRNAHDKNFSQTNSKFILKHDMTHNCDTIRMLTRKNIFSLFQQFYKHITYAEMDQKNRDILQLGFYLLTHEHLPIWNDYEHVQGSNLINMLNYGIDETINLLSASVLDFQLVSPNTMSGNMFYNNYMVLYHDSLQSIVSLIKKYNMLEATKFSDKCNNLKAANFSIRNFDGLDAFLIEFKINFKRLAKQICLIIE